MNWEARFSRQTGWAVIVLIGSALLFRMSVQDPSPTISYFTGTAAAAGWFAFPFKVLAAADAYAIYDAHLKNAPHPDRESLTFSYRMTRQLGEYWFYSTLFTCGILIAGGISVLVSLI